MSEVYDLVLVFSVMYRLRMFIYLYIGKTCYNFHCVFTKRNLLFGRINFSLILIVVKQLMKMLK